MPRITFTLCLLLIAASLSAQTTPTLQTGNFAGPFSISLSSSTSYGDLAKPKWDIIFQSLPNEADENLFHLKELKEEKMKQKLSFIANGGTSIAANKTAGINPTIGTNFKGNELKSWTPTDNSIAVSNGGKIVSCINQGIEYYDTSGNAFLLSQTWDAFINDPSLNQAKFDPRVIYDRLHDRFIVVLLHGFSSDKSKILTCFSKTNNPMDGWNIYKLSGNPFNDSSWTDYPTIGVSNDELFINGNNWGDAPNYPFRGTFIYQIGLTQGYAGNTLSYGLWNNIYTTDGNQGLTLYPASNGQGGDMNEKMYFVQLMPDSGSHVYLFEINGKLSSPSKTLTASTFSIPHYEVCADAFQKDPTTGFIDSLSTGSAWTQNAFYVNNTVHFTFDADISGGWCGLHYGRIYLDSNKAVVTSYGQAGTDLCYPAVASLGYDSIDRSVAIAFVRSDSTITPETGIISVDHTMTWSARQTVKAGDTSVNILYPPDYGIQPERWGDYTGICRKYNAGIPQVWMAGAYGANTPPRNNSYGTWIAQIITGEANVTGIASVQQDASTSMLYPNPATDMFALEFENNKIGQVSIDLYDATGHLVRNLFNDYLRESKNRISFNRLMLSRGMYLVRITRDGEIIANEKLLMQ